MQSSNEIKAVVQQFYAAMASGKATEFEKLLSREAGTLVIGTDPREWWSGYDVISHFYGLQIVEMGGKVQFEDSHIEAFSEGSVGWAADHATLVLNDGTRIPFRGTCVVHREEDGWKLVQWHVSVGAVNEEVVGKELTV